jgi:DNA excision repair protein ERCC-2
MDYNTFFPYDSYRNEQEEVIKYMYNALLRRRNIIFSAPNGTGKTIDNLSATIPVAIENNLKILYLCRTHTQNARVIDEIIKINKKNHERQSERGGNVHLISAVSLRGRTEMCLHRTIKKLRGSPSDMMRVCAELRKNRNCAYFRNMLKDKRKNDRLIKSLSKQSTDAQSIINISKNNQVCPYFLTKLLLKEVKVIVCNYQWVFNPEIQETFFKGAELELENCILIMDECHNLPNMAAEIDSERLTMYSIKQSIKDLESGRATREMINLVDKWVEIFEILKKSVKDEEVPLDPKIVLKTYLKKTKIKSKIELSNLLGELDEYGRAIYDEKLSSSPNAIDFLSVFLRFMFKFLDTLDDKRYFFTASPNKRIRKDSSINIEIVCMDPRELVNVIFNRSFATLNCSGTVNTDAYIKLLGLDKQVKEVDVVEIQSPFPKRNLKILITQGLSTRGKDRTDSMYSKINTTIAEIVFNTPANVGIFCASYVVLKGLLRNGLEKIIKFSGKKLYKENVENSASDNAEMIEDYKSDSKYKGAVLLGVCGGRNSEGEDFPGDHMNTVIVVGMPFHRPTPRVQAKIRYYDSIFNGKGKEYAYIVPTLQRSNQACGRPIRKLSDRGSIILLDERFYNYRELLSTWIRNNMDVVPDEKNYLAEEIKQFFKHTY